jgi:MFS transporter, DHA1 family, inner membrane transport protein
LREELNLSYSVAGLHISMFALGMSIAGFTGERVTARLGRYWTFWLGGLGMVIGAVIFVLVHIPALTITASFIMGLIGTYTLIMIQATLADEFGQQRAVALTESNIVAYVFVVLSPVAINLGMHLLNDWRLVFWLGIAFWILAFLVCRNLALPQCKISPDKPHIADNAPLPRLFWLYWTALFAAVSAEWCVIFWTPDFLINHTGLTPEAAAFAMTIFFIAIVVGRSIGSVLARRYRALYLLLIAQGIALVGFPFLWLSQTIILTYFGLILVGLGIANLFPLGLATASTIGEEQADKASSRISQAAGMAILIMPLLLGNVADRTGIFIAFGFGLILLIVQPIIVAYGLRMERASTVVQNI